MRDIIRIPTSEWGVSEVAVGTSFSDRIVLESRVNKFYKAFFPENNGSYNDMK